MIGDDRVVGEAGSNERGAGKINPVDLRQPRRLYDRRRCFEILWARIEQAREQDEAEVDQRGDQQGSEGKAIVAPTCQHHGHRQWSEHRAELVQSLVKAERPAVPANLLPRVRQHHVPRRIADRLPNPLEYDQNCSGRPTIHQREGRYRGHLHHITKNGDRPVLTGCIGQSARYQPQSVAQQFPEPGDHAHHGAARPQ